MTPAIVRERTTILDRRESSVIDRSDGEQYKAVRLSHSITPVWILYRDHLGWHYLGTYESLDQIRAAVLDDRVL